MFGPWIQAWEWLTAHLPQGGLGKRHINFITLHYIYIISCTIVASILIYVVGGMKYVDALFFASGAVTQSGLNTIDVNNIKTFQQVVLFIFTFLCNPIPINTFVVFIRLYWFEKRFQNIVREARNYRRTRSRSRTETKDERNPALEEQGVVGRDIRVLHRRQESMLTNGVAKSAIEVEKAEPMQNGVVRDLESVQGKMDAQDGNQEGPDVAKPLPFRRDITFADEVKATTPNTGTSARLPVPRPVEHHIAVLENQRNPKDKTALRIPGPRDFDRGEGPTAVSEDEADLELTKQTTSAGERAPRRLDDLSPPSNSNGVAGGSSDDPISKRSITIDEPTSPRSKNDRMHLPTLKLRRPGSMLSTSIGRNLFSPPTRTGTMTSLRNTPSRDPMPYLSWTPTIGRNSAFVDLTEEQREELGGIEYRALKTLAVILVGYTVVFYMFGVVCMLPWILRSRTYGSVVDNNGQSRTWWAFFTPASAFTNLGYAITADSMISFQRAVYPLLLLSFLIVVGNTGFPCMLRLILWTASRIVPADSHMWEELKFLLDHPRRCFTLLFPSYTTWWLFWILVVLNLLDVLLFIILDLNTHAVTELPVGIRIVDGFFQATASRTAGLACVNLALLHPAVQVSYMIMMYISVYPVAISLRSTNVYEEKSLGIYGNPGNEDANSTGDRTYMSAHLRKQLSFDLWYVVLGLFIITIVEGSRIENTNDYAFTIFSVLFEIVSAYGNIGLSLGYPNLNSSFSAEFKTLSKLVIIAMQIRGKHRGLPYALDRAILLPSESLQQKEEQDARNRMLRRASNLTTMEAAGIASIATTVPLAMNGSAIEKVQTGGGGPEKDKGNHID
ncbi:MAG: low affinity potassium transporter [Watsoniomyces obsoletus]|nr:MAG: low affinity potassium transporter [Watsoniomyces obsoletus]